MIPQKKTAFTESEKLGEQNCSQSNELSACGAIQCGEESSKM